jgi:hypothetical protein
MKILGMGEVKGYHLRGEAIMKMYEVKVIGKENLGKRRCGWGVATYKAKQPRWFTDLR